MDWHFGFVPRLSQKKKEKSPLLLWRKKIFTRLLKAQLLVPFLLFHRFLLRVKNHLRFHRCKWSKKKCTVNGYKREGEKKLIQKVKMDVKSMQLQLDWQLRPCCIYRRCNRFWCCSSKISTCHGAGESQKFNRAGSGSRVCYASGVWFHVNVWLACFGKYSNCWDLDPPIYRQPSKFSNGHNLYLYFFIFFPKFILFLVTRKIKLTETSSRQVFKNIWNLYCILTLLDRVQCETMEFIANKWLRTDVGCIKSISFHMLMYVSRHTHYLCKVHWRHREHVTGLLPVKSLIWAL